MENMADIATLVMSFAALISSAIMIYKVIPEIKKVNSETKKTDADTDKSHADTDKSHAETYAILSAQLKDAYTEIDKLRERLDKSDCHRDYQDYLLRGIARLTAALVAREIEIPWKPLSYEEFLKRRDNGNGKEKTEPIK
jgi:hypothetical protein